MLLNKTEICIESRKAWSPDGHNRDHLCPLRYSSVHIECVNMRNTNREMGAKLGKL